MRPLLFRPPFLVTGSSRLFSGFVFVTSSNVDTDMKRRPGEVGLYLRTGTLGTPSGCRHQDVRALPARPSEMTGRHDRIESQTHLDLSPLEDLDRVALADLDDRLLPAGSRASEHAAPLRLRLHLDDVDVHDLDVEQLLHGLADLRLVRVAVHLERVLVLTDLAVALLAHDRREQDLVRMEGHYEALPCSPSSAACVTSSERAQTTCATSTSPGTVTTTRSMLR